MKYKRIIIVGVVMLVLAMAWWLYTNWRTYFPSDQMKSLRQLEQNLSLPEAKYRYEEDLGFHHDSKGAPHYDRRIGLSYTDATVMEGLRTTLLTNGWKEEQYGPSYGDDVSFKYSKGQGDAMQCVGGFINPNDTDTPLYVSLEASGEYGCNPHPEI